MLAMFLSCGSVCLVCLVCLVRLVCLVCLVRLVRLVRLVCLVCLVCRNAYPFPCFPVPQLLTALLNALFKLQARKAVGAPTLAIDYHAAAADLLADLRPCNGIGIAVEKKGV